MEKIRALLEQLGGSKELVDQILESLESYKVSTKEALNKEFKGRLNKAKEAVLEDVTNYKRDLARKTQIFFESRVEKIEQQIAKQVAIKDSAAEAKLQKIVGLLEGVEANGQSNNAEFKAALKQVRELQEQVKKLDSSRKMLAEKANRAYTIAEKTLERNKVLSKELSEATQKIQKPISEGKAKSQLKDETTKPAEPATEAELIAEERKVAQPTTTRPTSDSQIAKKQAPKEQTPVVAGGLTPESIAAGMD